MQEAFLKVSVERGQVCPLTTDTTLAEDAQNPNNCTPNVNTYSSQITPMEMSSNSEESMVQDEEREEEEEGGVVVVETADKVNHERIVVVLSQLKTEDQKSEILVTFSTGLNPYSPPPSVLEVSDKKSSKEASEVEMSDKTNSKGSLPSVMEVITKTKKPSVIELSDKTSSRANHSIISISSDEA